jgi:hypothetical protein
LATAANAKTFGLSDGGTIGYRGGHSGEHFIILAPWRLGVERGGCKGLAEKVMAWAGNAFPISPDLSLTGDAARFLF